MARRQLFVRLEERFAQCLLEAKRRRACESLGELCADLGRASVTERGGGSEVERRASTCGAIFMAPV